MSLNPDQIQQLAKLVRFKLSAGEAGRFAGQLSDIVDMVAQMNQIDTDHIQPMSHPQDMRLRLREDNVTESDRRKEFQSAAPAADAGLYLVPRVVE